MLAVDAASEIRSLTLLYERYADRLYRYFLFATADHEIAIRMMRDLIQRLPEELQRYSGEERSFAGWLFGLASRTFWEEYSLVSRVYRRASRYLPARVTSSTGKPTPDTESRRTPQGFEDISDALRIMPADQREVLGIRFGARLATAPAAEALRMPASLMASHIERALQMLASQLESTNTTRLSEDLESRSGQQRLPDDLRRDHFALMHARFFGEIQIEEETRERSPVMEVAALVGVVLIGLIGIWVWGLVTPGDQQEHEVQSPPAAMEVADDDPTATPEIEPTPEPTSEPEQDEQPVALGDQQSDVCLAAEGKAAFDLFVRSFNDGDFARMREMLPAGSYDHPLAPETAQQTGGLHDFFMHDMTSLSDRDAIISYLRERYGDGERWTVLQAYPAEHYRYWQAAAPLEMYQDWKRENPGLGMVIVAGLDWSGEDNAEQLAQGRVVIDCEAGLVIDWDLHRYDMAFDGPVTVADLLPLAEPPEPGQQHEITARISTGLRQDGGALQTWTLYAATTTTSDGEAARRVEIRMIDHDPAITFVDDGTRWQLDQRGWRMHGGSDTPPWPEEIALGFPWINEVAYLLSEASIGPDYEGSLTLIEDYSHTAPSSTERLLEIQVREGALQTVRLRERTPDGEHIRPEIRILDVNQSAVSDPDMFRVSMEPRFPELEVGSPRFSAPVDELDALELFDIRADGDQTFETYRMSWNGTEFDLRVRPSRGGLDPASIPEGVDQSWSTAYAEYDYGKLVWAHRHFAGYPTDAIWDDGRYRFELSIDRRALGDDHDWNLDELLEFANEVSARESEASGSSTSQVARPSMNIPAVFSMSRAR